MTAIDRTAEQCIYMAEAYPKLNGDDTCYGFPTRRVTTPVVGSPPRGRGFSHDHSTGEIKWYEIRTDGASRDRSAARQMEPGA